MPKQNFINREIINDIDLIWNKSKRKEKINLINIPKNHKIKIKEQKEM